MNIKVNNNLIYGRNPVREALKAGRIKKVFITKSFSDKEILADIESSNAEMCFVTNNELDEAVKGCHQGVCAIIKEYTYHSLSEIIKKAESKEKKIILLLDGINDPQNLGAILRSADIFDVAGVVIPKHNQVQLTATVAKTSAGAINYVPVVLVSNLNNAIKELKESGYWIVSTDGSGKVNYQDIKYDVPIGLVIGSEGYGVSSLVVKNSDFVVKIPMYGHVNSLNASVAAGILLAKIKE